MNDWSLINAKENQIVVISKITLSDLKLKKRLIEFGFVSGEKLLIIKKSKVASLMLVSVRGAMLGIDFSLCSNIFVF